MSTTTVQRRRGVRSELELFARRYVRCVPSCLAIFTVGAVSEYRRALLLRVFRALGNRDLELAIGGCEIDDLVGEDGRAIRMRELRAANGNVSAAELAVINKLVADRRPGAIFEIGTFDGRTTLNLAANAPEDARIYTLDLPRERMGSTAYHISAGDRQYVEKAGSGLRFAGTDCADRITQLYGDSATFDFEAYRGAMDLVFVDGAHTYDYVISDSWNALRMLRGGRGVILWHDYDGWPEVTAALNDLSREGAFEGMRHVRGTSLVCLVRD